jgi:hypothetical protein
MTPLYVLAAEHRQALQRLDEMDLDEQTLAGTLESLRGELETKAVSVAKFIKNMQATADAMKSAEAGIAARRKVVDAKIESIREYLKSNMESAQITKISSAELDLTIKKTPPSVDVFEAALLPESFMRYAPAPPPAPDKAAIAAAIKSGQEVQGARLVSGTRLEIK